MKLSCSALSRQIFVLPASVLLAAASFAFAPTASAQNAPTNFSLAGMDDAAPAPPKSVRSLDLTAIDKTADPCTDFYQYACGNWIKDNPVPGDQTRWARSFSMLQERNRYLLWQELDAAAKDPKTALQKKYGDFYASCMNTALVDKEGLAPLAPAFKEIDGFSD